MTFFSHGNLNPKNRNFEFVLQLAKKLQHVSTCTCLQIIMNFFLFFLRKSSDDQDNLERYMESLPHDKHRFHLQKATNDDDGRQFLFVHQTSDQQRLMKRYGNEICLLDATYKTSRYALPLFFVAVPKNTRYQVIASFIISSETTESISQALKVLSRWNPDWKPANWMTDCCQAEISAAENVFPGVLRSK